MKRLVMVIREVWGAVTGRGLNLETWYEAEAAETRANLRHLGITTIVTASDIRDTARWSAQDRREQLDIAWIAQARREAMNIAAIEQEEE